MGRYSFLIDRVIRLARRTGALPDIPLFDNRTPLRGTLPSAFRPAALQAARLRRAPLD